MYTLQNASGSVPAGGKATITVQPLAVPRAPASIAGTQLGDTLTVTTGAGGGGAGATIPITQTGSGAVLSVSMASTAFGGVALGSPASLPIQVVNNGSVTADLQAQPTGTGFGVTGFPAQVASSNSFFGDVTFAAQPPYGVVSGSVTVTTTTNLCQPAQPAPLSLSATSEGPVASLDTSTLNFTVECLGTTAPTATVTVTNAGTSDLLLSGAGVTAGFSIVSATATAIAPGKQGTVVVSASTTPLSGDRAGTNRIGKLTFTTNEYGSPTQSVTLSAALDGANIDYYGDANHTQLVTSAEVWCGGSPPPTPPVDPWWSCVYQGTGYFLYNSGNEDATFAPPVFSDPQLTGNPAVTGNFTIKAGGITSEYYPYWSDVATSAPPGCPSGESTYPASLSYPVVAGSHVCHIAPLSVPIVGDPTKPCP
jgi:hypothetical protein